MTEQALESIRRGARLILIGRLEGAESIVSRPEEFPHIDRRNLAELLRETIDALSEEAAD